MSDVPSRFHDNRPAIMAAGYDAGMCQRLMEVARPLCPVVRASADGASASPLGPMPPDRIPNQEHDYPPRPVARHVGGVAVGNDVQLPRDAIDRAESVYPEAELQQKLSTLAIVRRLNEGETSDMSLVERTLSSYVHADSTIHRVHGWPPSETGAENARQLAAVDVGVQIESYARAHVEAATTDRPARIAWGEASLNLLESAAELSGQPRENRLVAAVVAAQFAEGDARRVALLHAAYDSGVQREVAQALSASSLVILAGEPIMQGPEGDSGLAQPFDTVHSYARVFRLEPEQMRTHLEVMARQPAETLPSAKELHHTLTTTPVDSPDYRWAARQSLDVSVSHEKGDTPLLDPYKIQRLALEGLFIRDQMTTLFGTTPDDLQHSPFAQALRNLHNARQPNTAGDQEDMSPQARYARNADQFLSDLMIAFSTLSAPIVARYDLTDVDTSNPARLTEEQRRAHRYQTVFAHMQEVLALGRYINMDRFEHHAAREMVSRFLFFFPRISSGAAPGGAAPSAIYEVLGAVMHEALAFSAQHPGKQPPQPDELLLGLHAHRSKVLLVAAHNIAEQRAVNDQVVHHVTLVRDDTGRLRMSMTMAGVPRGSLDVYAGTTVGCPGLRVTHDARAELDTATRAEHGSANFIDHVAAAAFNEAAARGLLDIAQYQPQP